VSPLALNGRANRTAEFEQPDSLLLVVVARLFARPPFSAPLGLCVAA